MQLTLPAAEFVSHCRQCGSDRLLHVKGTAVARLIGTTLEGEGEIELVICLECGQVEGAWPMKSKNYGWSE